MKPHFAKLTKPLRLLCCHIQDEYSRIHALLRTNCQKGTRQIRDPGEVVYLIDASYFSSTQCRIKVGDISQNALVLHYPIRAVFIRHPVLGCEGDLWRVLKRCRKLQE